MAGSNAHTSLQIVRASGDGAATVFFAQWLGRDPAWQHAHPAVALRDLDRWGLGLAALFFDVPLSAREVPTRVLAYIQAFRALRPHRACSFSDTPHEALLQEPLFFNPRIRGPECGAPLSGISWRPVAEAGVRRVGDLRRLLTAALPPGVSSGQRSVLLAALPQVWRAALNSNINLDSPELGQLVFAAKSASGSARLCALTALVSVERLSTYCARPACACWAFFFFFLKEGHALQ